MFINSHVSLKAFTCFQQYKKMYIQKLICLLKFLNNLDSWKHMLWGIMLIFILIWFLPICEAKCHFNMYWPMPYSSGQKLSLQRNATESPYTGFCHQGNGFLMIQMLQEHRFLPSKLPILCKVERFFIPAFSHTTDVHLLDVQYITTSVGTSTSQQQARFCSVILLIPVGLFISNFWHFVHSELFMFLVRVKLAWSSLFSPLQQVPRPRPNMIVYFTS